ncbi:ADP ribosylation factor interacting protein arfaptin isoform X3 [Rhipicephalus microplus]|uniref:ADP ribosylation factor interacting protein arfaptin isoform X3 n=1 Tax=Rhipicephalus microplus TaxID=6941 RepID=UPI003F6D03EC
MSFNIEESWILAGSCYEGMTEVSSPSHSADSGREFEEDLRKALDEAPPLNESRDVVHSGGAMPHPEGHRSTSQQQQRSNAPPSSFSSPWAAQPPVKNEACGFLLGCGLPAVRHATTSVPLTTPSPVQNGSDPRVTKAGQSKIDYLRQWSVSTYKCTRQMLSEKLGKVRPGTRTVDTELEAQIEQLRDTQAKYLHVLRLARALASHFHQVVQTQGCLAEAFQELAHRSPPLQEEFRYNAEAQRSLSKNGETLLGALNFFVSSLATLCHKTIDDTLLTVRQYESARLEYDAYRTDLEELTQGTQGTAISSKMDEAQRNFAIHRDKYEKLKADVTIKMKFLEENKVKVMHKQLLLFHNAVSSYFSGNQASLEATLKQFNIKRWWHRV